MAPLLDGMVHCGSAKRKDPVLNDAVFFAGFYLPMSSALSPASLGRIEALCRSSHEALSCRGAALVWASCVQQVCRCAQLRVSPEMLAYMSIRELKSLISQLPFSSAFFHRGMVPLFVTREIQLIASLSSEVTSTQKDASRMVIGRFHFDEEDLLVVADGEEEVPAGEMLFCFSSEVSFRLPKCGYGNESICLAVSFGCGKNGINVLEVSSIVKPLAVVCQLTIDFYLVNPDKSGMLVARNVQVVVDGGYSQLVLPGLDIADDFTQRALTSCHGVLGIVVVQCQEVAMSKAQISQNHRKPPVTTSSKASLLNSLGLSLPNRSFAPPRS